MEKLDAAANSSKKAGIPLVGEGREGAPGIGLPVEAGPPCISRRGKAPAIRQAWPLRLTDLSLSSVRCSMAGDPLLARPSAESVLPTRGRRSNSASKCVNAVGPERERGQG